MRTSTQLMNVNQCKMNTANVTEITDSMKRALAQKDVLCRLLIGEPIDDIKGEIESILLSENCPFENREQQRATLSLWEARIKRYVNYQNTLVNENTNTIRIWKDEIEYHELIYHDDNEQTDTTVDFFGEPIKVNPDFFMVDGDDVTVVKVTTSRFKKGNADLQQYETYVLGLLGEKLFPGKNIFVEYDYLGDADTKTERAYISKPYDDRHAKKISAVAFDENTKAYFTEKHEEEVRNPHICTPEECANCASKNVCNYVEAPTSIDVIKEIRPASEIRLTHAQQEIIDFERGNARVNAGAGAGKTLVVAMRIKELLKKGYLPEDICLLTFTRAGADEMTARVIAYCAEEGLLVDPSRLKSTTFNTFCMDLLKEHYNELGYSRAPKVIPDETRSGIINRLLNQFPHVSEWNYVVNSREGNAQKYDKNNSLNAARRLFYEIKKEGYTRDENPYIDIYTSLSLDSIFGMYEEYNRILKERCFLEFDDQLLKVFDLLEVHPDLFAEIGYKHIIVDEFQDTDLPQIKLLNKINDTPSFLSYMAVGDDSQAIFSFRHTSPKYMINFGEYFGRFTDFALTENHRSNGNTIDFANKVNNLATDKIDKDLIATKEPGAMPIVEGFYTRKSEYEWIANDIKTKVDGGMVPSDIAFIASTGEELTAMASYLTKLGIPSILMNPIPYMDNSRVAALCTFFNSFLEGTTRGMIDYANVTVHGALKGASKEEIATITNNMTVELTEAPKTVEKFLEYAKKLDENETDECYQDFLGKIEHCISIDELIEFFRDFKLYGQDSKYKREGKYEGVCLTTVHSAKGLEWDTTYLSLSKFDKADYHRSYSKYVENGEKNENIRKWFVGATRAKSNLIMTGQYVLEGNKTNFVLNDYVKIGFELMGKVYGYQPGAYWEQRRQEELEELRVNSGTRRLIGIGRNTNQPQDEYVLPSNNTNARVDANGRRIAPYRDNYGVRTNAVANTTEMESTATTTANTNQTPDVSSVPPTAESTEYDDVEFI